MGYFSSAKTRILLGFCCALMFHKDYIQTLPAFVRALEITEPGSLVKTPNCALKMSNLYCIYLFLSKGDYIIKTINNSQTQKFLS